MNIVIVVSKIFAQISLSKHSQAAFLGRRKAIHLWVWSGHRSRNFMPAVCCSSKVLL